MKNPFLLKNLSILLTRSFFLLNLFCHNKKLLRLTKCKSLFNKKWDCSLVKPDLKKNPERFNKGYEKINSVNRLWWWKKIFRQVSLKNVRQKKNRLWKSFENKMIQKWMKILKKKTGFIMTKKKQVIVKFF